MMKFDDPIVEVKQSGERAVALRGFNRGASVRACLLTTVLGLTWVGAGWPATAQSPDEQVEVEVGAETETEMGTESQTEANLAIEKLIEEANLYYGNGLKAYRSKNYEEAIDWFTLGVALDDGDARWYADRARSYAMLHRFDEADEDYGRAIAAVMAYDVTSDWSLAVLYYNRGNARHRAGEFLGALSDYDRVLELDADDEFQGVHNAMGFLLATAPDDEIRDGERALEALAVALERTAEKSEDRVNVLDSLACAYAERGRFDEAVATMAAGLEMAGELELEGDAMTELREREALFRAGKPYRFDGMKQVGSP